MTEAEFRNAVVDEALSWMGTPYRQSGPIKGVGTNCAQFLLSVGKAIGAIPDDAAVDWFPAQFAVHSSEEKLIGNFLRLGAVEVVNPQRGDLILFRTGRAYGHAGIIESYPKKIIHALPPCGVQYGDAFEGRLGRFQRRFYSMWKVA